jgi:uncharacterized membrane protein
MRTHRQKGLASNSFAGNATIALLLFALSISAFAQQSPAATFKSIDFPGAVLTQVQGINPEGEMVGLYVDTAGKQHGFLYRRGDFSSIDYPGAIATDARGINRNGDIVGSFTNVPGGPPNIHGYLLSHGAFSEVQFPGYLGTIAQRISPEGDIYGCNHNTDLMATMHGFRRTEDGYTQLDVQASMNNGATPDGSTVVGLFTDMMTGLTHGFMIKNSNFEPFDVPGSNLTQAWDIDPAGHVVGNFRDTTGETHGFLRSDSQYAAIDFPGAIATAARGINPEGEIVGWYIDSTGKTHGFLRRRAE